MQNVGSHCSLVHRKHLSAQFIRSPHKIRQSCSLWHIKRSRRRFPHTHQTSCVASHFSPACPVHFCSTTRLTHYHQKSQRPVCSEPSNFSHVCSLVTQNCLASQTHSCQTNVPGFCSLGAYKTSQITTHSASPHINALCSFFPHKCPPSQLIQVSQTSPSTNSSRRRGEWSPLLRRLPHTPAFSRTFFLDFFGAGLSSSSAMGQFCGGMNPTCPPCSNTHGVVRATGQDVDLLGHPLQDFQRRVRFSARHSYLGFLLTSESLSTSRHTEAVISLRAFSSPLSSTAATSSSSLATTSNSLASIFFLSSAQ